MDLLRRPVARATCAAVLDGIDPATRDRVADEVLAWIDALAPVIASPRAPRRWSRVRRHEQRARVALEQSLADVLADCGVTDTPPVVATMLAAGIQVPIAAGAWLLVHLAGHPERVVDPDHAVWETLRLTPPTWVTARMTTAPIEVGGPAAAGRRRGPGEPAAPRPLPRPGAGHPRGPHPASAPSGGRGRRPTGGLAALRRRRARLPRPHPGPRAAARPRVVGGAALPRVDLVRHNRPEPGNPPRRPPASRSCPGRRSTNDRLRCAASRAARHARVPSRLRARLSRVSTPGRRWTRRLALIAAAPAGARRASKRSRPR